MSSEKLRVLHVSSWDIPCGIATYCANLVKGLNAAGVENAVFPLYPHEWKTYLPGDVSLLMKRLEAEARNYDVVHFQHEHGLYGHSRGGGYSARRFADFLNVLKRIGRPSVTTFHTLISPPSKRAPVLLGNVKEWIRTRKWRYRIAPHFGDAPGQCRAILHTALSRFAFARAGFSTASMHVMPHACLPPREHAIDRATAKRQLGFSPDDCVLSLFGFVSNYKGHELAIRVLRKLPNHFRLAIVGGSHPESRDGFLNRLLGKVDDSVRNRVTITGYVPADVASRYFTATDICLAPYRAHGDPAASGAITWALSSGRPTIASKIEAFQTIDREANCLMLVTPDCTSELAWAIQSLSNEPARQRALVKNSLSYCEKYSWNSTAQSTLRIYEQILGRSYAAHQGSEGSIPVKQVA